MAITEKDIVLCGHGCGTPNTVNMYTYNSSRYASKAPNGVRKGVVSVKRLKQMTDAKQIKFHDTYKTILGRNIYSQNLRNYCYKQYKDGNYYSDCSSSYCLTLNKIGYTNVPILNTAGIYQSDLFETVDVRIVNGHIMNPEVLKVGDALLYVGSDPSRPKQIGHVEMIYEINSSSSETYTKIGMTTSSSGIKVLSNLNIRKAPSTSSQVLDTYKKGTIVYPTVRTTIDNQGWFLTDKGWISAIYCSGWIKDAGSGRWWYLTDSQKYEWFTNTVQEINNAYYAFDKNGYMVDSSHINADGSIRL